MLQWSSFVLNYVRVLGYTARSFATNEAVACPTAISGFFYENLGRIGKVGGGEGANAGGGVTDKTRFLRGKRKRTNLWDYLFKREVFNSASPAIP